MGECFRDPPIVIGGTPVHFPNYTCWPDAIYIHQRGSEKSYPAQKEAIYTHLQFLRSLKKRGITLSLIVNTYTTPYNKEIISWYSEFSPKIIFNENLIGVDSLINNSLLHLDTLESDVMFIMRIDLHIKDYFIEHFNPYVKTIHFPCLCSHINGWDKITHAEGYGELRVNDVMLLIPKNYYRVLDYVSLNHHSWHTLKKIYGFTDDDMDFMLETYHDSNTNVDWNPYYIIVNRHTEMYWLSRGFRFDKKSGQPVEISLSPY